MKRKLNMELFWKEIFPLVTIFILSIVFVISIFLIEYNYNISSYKFDAHIKHTCSDKVPLYNLVVEPRLSVGDNYCNICGDELSGTNVTFNYIGHCDTCKTSNKTGDYCKKCGNTLRDFSVNISDTNFKNYSDYLMLNMVYSFLVLATPVTIVVTIISLVRIVFYNKEINEKYGSLFYEEA